MKLGKLLFSSAIQSNAASAMRVYLEASWCGWSEAEQWVTVTGQCLQPEGNQETRNDQSRDHAFSRD